MASPLRIALCTDTHTWLMASAKKGDGGSLLHVDQAEYLHSLLLKEMVAAGMDLALHLGDMTNGGGFFEMPAGCFAPQLEHVAHMWRDLPFPVYALPGNHDCPPGGSGLPEASGAQLNGHTNSAWREFETLWGLESGIGRTVDLGEATLILVNAQGHSAAQVAAALPDDPVYGWLSDEELARIEADLNAAAERPVLLAMHQLLQPWQANRPWKEFYRIRNGRRLLDLMESSRNVRAVFQGHAHFYEVQKLQVGGREVPFVICPAIIESPIAWLQLTIDEAGMDVELMRLPTGLLTPPEQEWRAGRKAWQNWTLHW